MRRLQSPHSSMYYSMCSITCLSASLGTLEFNLLYEKETSSLHCTVLKAKVEN